MKHILLSAIIVFAPAKLAANELLVWFQDGNPADRILVHNTGCPISGAKLTIDFRSSSGKVLIDTTYGGPGSRDPLDVQVARGDIRIIPPQDGAQILEIMIDDMQRGAIAEVTMDVDDQISATENMRVGVSGSEVAGTTVRLQLHQSTGDATLNETGRTAIAVPDEDCSPPSVMS